MNASEYGIRCATRHHGCLAAERRDVRRRGVVGAALVTALLLAAVLVLSGCAPKSNAVDIHDLYFDPPALTVPAGTTITWTVHDETAHIIQTDDYQVKGKSQVGQFASDPLNPGGSFSHTFDKPGTYPYTDPLQGYMHGTVVVK